MRTTIFAPSLEPLAIFRETQTTFLLAPFFVLVPQAPGATHPRRLASA